MPSKILHGFDGSEGSFAALREALALARGFGAELHTITVEEVPRYPGAIGEVVVEKVVATGGFAPLLEQVREAGRQADVKVHTHVLVGHEVKTIVEFLRQGGFDLLVVGFMGHSALYDRVMGSTCQSLVRLSPCSVLVVK